MALIDRWRRQSPWFAMGLAGLGASLLGPIGTLASVVPWAIGNSSTPYQPRSDHPLRQRILTVLGEHPGLAYRELQGTLSAANGTLRHHLDVLIGRGEITVVGVNGRSCHFAGHPAQHLELRGAQVGEDELNRLIEQQPHGLSVLQRQVVEAIASDEDLRSQSDIARFLGRSRTSIHSAIKVLRRRGILDANELSLAPHLSKVKYIQRKTDYQWNDGRENNLI